MRTLYSKLSGNQLPAHTSTDVLRTPVKCFMKPFGRNWQDGAKYDKQARVGLFATISYRRYPLLLFQKNYPTPTPSLQTLYEHPLKQRYGYWQLIASYFTVKITDNFHSVGT